MNTDEHGWLRPGSEGATGKVFTTRFRARYAETDATGIVYYNQYFVYLEVGRIEMFRELGLTYDRHLPIVETGCRYHASAVFDDLLEVETFVEEVRAKRFRLGGKVFRIGGDGSRTVLVEGFCAMVTVGDDNRPVPLPPAFRAAFGEPSPAP
ncbi:MAG: acyl-CoA thioesterase [Deltaproteobacteria bacterium]|nr:acyl-CoA thioesterase [Deltaproteobacteria bacterium]